MQAFASVDQERGAGEVAFARGVELGENGDQFDGKIVYAVKAHVLKGVQHGALAGAGESGKNDELARGAAGGVGGENF